LAGIEAIAMDMWGPFIRATREHVPDAEGKIVFDRFLDSGENPGGSGLCTLWFRIGLCLRAQPPRAGITRIPS
jgi:Transposase